MKWILPAILLALTNCHAPLLAGTRPVPTAATTAPAKVAGRVVGIHDGDSLTVLIARQQVKVRIEGIDAPEHRQSFSAASKEALSALVAGRTVHIAATGKDRYGRTLARVYADGADVGREMIRRGFAWHFLRYNKEKDLAAAEIEARQLRRGLWADVAPSQALATMSGVPPIQCTYLLAFTKDFLLAATMFTDRWLSGGALALVLSWALYLTFSTAFPACCS